jgi:hypothetical protein
VRGAAPRAALSFALSHRSFEAGPFFDRSALPFPPLALRVALRAGQAVAYAAQSPLSRAQLALDARTFSASRRLFRANYVTRIEGDAQWLRFLACLLYTSPSPRD